MSSLVPAVTSAASSTTAASAAPDDQQQQQQQPMSKQHTPPLLTPSHSSVSSVSNAAISISRGRLYRCLPGPGVLGAVVSAAELLSDNDDENKNLQSTEAGTRDGEVVTTRNKQQTGPASLTTPTSFFVAPNSKSTTLSPSSTQAPLQTPGTSKLVTREIAALDFLMNIPLRQERDIVRAGVQAQITKDQHEESLHYHRDHGTGGESDVVGSAPTVGVPLGVDEPSLAPSHEGTATTAAGSINAVGGGSTANGAPTNHLFHLHWWERLMGSDAPHKNRQRKIQQDLEEEKELEKPDQGGLDSGDLESNTGRRRGGGRHSEILPVMVQGSPDHRAVGNGLSRRGSSSNIKRLTAHNRSNSAAVDSFFAAQHVAPGRRLNGIEPVAVVRPPKVICNGMENFRKILSSTGGGGRSVAINSAVREWEVKLAHGIGDTNNKMNTQQQQQQQSQHKGGLLDGRSFFSMQSSYPLGVFSVIRYEPKKEEAARRRRKLEEMGGGGTQFVLPVRDWRGVSYAALLKPREGSIANNNTNGPSITTKRRRRRQRGGHQTSISISDNPSGNVLNGTSTDDDEQLRDTEHEFSSSSSGEDGRESNEEYQPGFLDDPAMVQGKHRHVMVGDKVTGPIVSSVIQFVDPVDLKKDLNKQFRDRFDGWEPPSSQRKYIGAKVMNGLYTLIDPTMGLSKASLSSDNEEEDASSSRRSSQSSPSKQTSASAPSKQSPPTTDIIRMPPSLTLSKIRSLKSKILRIGLKAQLELSTVALSFVYFERLCLDCRVDKSNRHLSFAACLLLAYKTNEPNVAVITTQQDESSNPSTASLIKEHTSKAIKTKAVQQLILQTFVRPAKKSVGVFTSLLDHLTNDFSLSLKHLFAAEWGVFVALGFKLHAKPSQVAFHFRRILKVLERSALSYLGDEMYGHWQYALTEESKQKERHEERRRARRERKERKLLKLQRKAMQQQQQKQLSNHNRRRSSTGTNSSRSLGSEVKPSKTRLPCHDQTEPLSTAALEHFDRQPRGNTQGSPTRPGDVSESGKRGDSSIPEMSSPASSDPKFRRAASLRNKLTLSGVPVNMSIPSTRSTSLSPARKTALAGVAATTTSASHSDEETNFSLPPLSASHGNTSTSHSPLMPAPKSIHPRRNSIKGWAGQIKHFRSNINPSEKVSSSVKRGATEDNMLTNPQQQQQQRGLPSHSPLITRKKLLGTTGTSRTAPPRPPSPVNQANRSIAMISKSSSSPHLSQLEQEMTKFEEESSSSSANLLRYSQRKTNKSNPNLFSRSSSLPPDSGDSFACETEIKETVSRELITSGTSDHGSITSMTLSDQLPQEEKNGSIDDMV